MKQIYVEEMVPRLIIAIEILEINKENNYGDK